MGRGRRRSSRPTGIAPLREGATHLGAAWYRADQWERLRELASDSETLEDQHAEWLRSAEETMSSLQTRGISVEKVSIDVDAAAEWASQRNRPFDSSARSEYVADLLRRRTEDGPEDPT